MSDDIVNRLRTWLYETPVCMEAADEIERLTAALRAISDKSRTEIDCSPGQLAKIADEALRSYQQSTTFDHEVHCNADRRKPIGCDMCSCSTRQP